MKIIFLDIDWVLIRIGNVTEADKEYHRTRSKEKWKEWCLLLWAFVPECVENLKKIIEATHAMIVISSSWRHDMEKLKESWLDAGLDWNLIISKTPHSLWHGRWNEILTWLTDYHKTCKHGYHVSHWVAIDDDIGDMKSITRLGKMVRTVCHKWLTDEDVEQVISILNT